MRTRRGKRGNTLLGTRARFETFSAKTKANISANGTESGRRVTSATRRLAASPVARFRSEYFAWDPSEIRDVLGEDEGEYFCEWYGVRPEGNFRDEATGRFTGRSILFLSKKIIPASEERLAPARAALLAARSRRVPPALDDKRIAGWIALAVSGLAIAGRILNEGRFL